MSALSTFTRLLLARAGVGLGLAVPISAWAHPGHATEGLLAGIVHPLTGADHLLATLGVGVLAGWALSARARKPAAAAHTPDTPTGASAWQLAAGVAMGVITGLALSAGGGPDAAFSSAIELAAALSLVVLSLLILGVERLPAVALAFALALVSLPHGYLHGAESSGVTFAAGLTLASAALLALGFGLGGRAASLGDRLRHLARGAFAAGLALFSAGLVLG